MLFDPDHVPFSRRERFLTISQMDGELWLRSVRGGDLRPSLGRLCRMSVRGRDAGGTPAVRMLAPGKLTVSVPGGQVEACIGSGERLHLRGRGCALTLALEGSRYDYAYRTPDGGHCLVAAYEDTRLMPRARRGRVTVSGDWRRDHADNVAMTFDGGDDGFEASIDLFRALPPPPDARDFDTVHAESAAEFAAWLAAAPRGGDDEARRLAAYVLWSGTVPAGGLLSRPAIFMSKNHMINVWSWDNAFSALGVAAMDPGLAFDQFAVIFDRQDASGLLPDFVNDRDASFAFTKPPVHGWAILRLLDRYPDWLTADRKRLLNQWLERQVGYWLTHARKSGSDLPVYFHGNDSGWDNATFFAEGGPVMSPDLPTFLVLSCDCLARLADDAARADQWRAQGDAILALLMAHLATGDGFGTRLATDAARLRRDDSLIGFMPLLLGPRLPRPLADAMIRRLETGGWLTEWGLATERPSSAFYESDGYWRGPIWAPTTMLVWDGLVQQARTDLAETVARRFLRLCETSGMAENFDALTGAGLRDRAFAWTSAVYLWLASSLRGEQAGARVRT